MTGWYVVKFTKEKNLIEVIPSNWIQNFRECLWPEKLGTLKLQAAIKNRSRPSDDWKLHPIKVISKQMYSNYKDASKCADETLALNSSASETELTQNQSINKRKRTCKADNNNGLSSSDDEEQSTVAHNIPDFPNFTSIVQEIDEDIVEEGTKSNIYNKNYHNQDSFVNNTNSLIVEQPDNLTVCQLEENEDPLLQELQAVMDVEDENSLSVHNEYGEYPSSLLVEKKDCDSEVQTQIMRQLVTLNARSKEHGEYLHTILMILNDIQEKQKSSDNQPATPSSMLEFEPIYETLPVTNEESLNLLQQALTNDQTLFNKTVKMLSLIGGSDIKESVRRILRKLISNEYAKQFSYTGHKSSKHAFNKTILSSLLIRVVLAIAVALLVGGLLVVAFFTAAVELVIDDQITLRPGSQTFEMWRKPPVRPLLKVYVYNVTNADEFLNVIAPGEVREKPILDELGPFVYVETWEKVNLTFHDNGTLTYNQQKVYRFDPEQSVGSEDDIVVVPNIPMLSATSQSKHAARFLRLAMASIMDILKVKPFVEVSVGQLLWGYEDPLLKLAKDVVPKEQKLPYEEFGLLYGLQYIIDQYDVKTLPELLGYLRLDRLLSADGPLLDGILSAGTKIILGGNQWPTAIQTVPMAKDYNLQPELEYQAVHTAKITRMSLMGRPKNGTSRDNMTVFTGATDIRLFAALDKFNGRTHLPHWTTDSCNRMSGGSDGSLFPPRIQPDTILHVFDKDMCRKLPLVFKKQVEAKGGVKAYRFGPDHRAFADPDHEPENRCYCPSLSSPSGNSTSGTSSSNTAMPTVSTKMSSPQCAPHGTFNVSLCQYDSPVLLSFPHFYMGDPRLREAVHGMDEPDADRHEFYIDVQPEMGVAMRARARVQINLAVSQVVDIKQVATFPDIVFPIMWFEEGIDELPDNVIQLLKLATQTPPVAKAALQYALFASGAVLLLLALGCLVRNSHRQETMSLEGTAHYSQDEKKKPKKTIPPAPLNTTVLSNGNGTAAKANAGYVADDE